MKNFLIKLSIFSIIIAVIDFCWICFMPVEKHIPHVWLIVIFFIAVTITFHFLALNASKGRPASIIRFHMGTTALRLFLYVLIIVSYRFYDKLTFIPFTIGFMTHYFLFTVFEVPVLLRELKKS